MSKLTLHTLAGQITHRWKSAENLYKNLSDLDDRLNTEMANHIQLEHLRHLRNSVQTILKTIFSSHGAIYVELMKLRLQEVTKINLMFTSKTLYCTLKLSILANIYSCPKSFMYQVTKGTSSHHPILWTKFKRLDQMHQ